jgi:hypothetical protein
MKKQFPTKVLLPLFISMILVMAGCGGTTTPTPATSTPTPTPVPPTVTEQMSKSWKVTSAKEDGTTVFTSGDGSSLRLGYSDFKLDLTSLSAAKLTAVDARAFTGKWSISADGKTLTLTELNPEPTGTGGTIAYDIAGLTATAVLLTRNTTNRKTGAAKTEYQLTNQ